VKIEIIDELNERFNLKNPSSQEEIELNENYLNYNYKSKIDLPTCKEFIDRNFIAFKKILNNVNETDTILIVAHSCTLYALNAFICGIPNDGYIKWIRSGNCSKICYELMEKEV
jgi:bisphosphoglycerate-dependent phosphoglycerate mutase